MTFFGSAASPEQFPRDGLPEVAFLGRSNVGKSSLLNALAGVKGLARVSSSPGRTRLVNFFRLGNDFYLADLPGYGYARVGEAMRRGWEGLVNSYLGGRDALALCVFPTESDETLAAYLDHHRLPYVLAATKADHLGRGEVLRRRANLERGLGRKARAVLAVSATTGSGVKELWRTIRASVASRGES